MSSPEEALASVDHNSQTEPVPGPILAAIVAAATVVIGKRFHIRGIQPIPSSQERVSKWSRQGRVLVHSSHNLAVKHSPKAR